MDKPIGVGDWVQVIHWPRCCGGRLGLIFKVAMIDHDCELYCGGPDCRTWKLTIFRGPVAGIKGKVFAPLPWLKRIPPLAELESVERTEKVNA